MDADGTVFYRCPVDPDDLARLLDWWRRAAFPAGWSSEQCAINRLTPAAARALGGHPNAAAEARRPARDQCREPVYKFSLFPAAGLPMELLPHFAAKTPVLCLRPRSFSAAGGKQQAFAATLARAGLAPAQCMAFGDSDNDIGLTAAGIGVAMEARGRTAREAAADFITRDCEADGIRYALEYFLYCNQYFGSGHGRVFTSAALLHRRNG